MVTTNSAVLMGTSAARPGHQMSLGSGVPWQAKTDSWTSQAG
jgi:hypothetical protein